MAPPHDYGAAVARRCLSPAGRALAERLRERRSARTRLHLPLPVPHAAVLAAPEARRRAARCVARALVQRRVALPPDASGEDLLALYDALCAEAKLRARQADVVESTSLFR
jgi:hypothetical protein